MLVALHMRRTAWIVVDAVIIFPVESYSNPAWPAILVLAAGWTARYCRIRSYLISIRNHGTRTINALTGTPGCPPSQRLTSQFNA
ncbi:MAG: hypothetical protein ACRDSR_12085 [Pseudonocardiaceae bacterium]